MNSSYDESDEAVKEVREILEAYDIVIRDLLSYRDKLIKNFDAGIELYAKLMSHRFEHENLSEFYMQKSQAELAMFGLNDVIASAHSEILKTTIEVMNSTLI